MSKKERKIDKINSLERTHYPLEPRNQVEEKYFQETQKRNKERYDKEKLKI